MVRAVLADLHLGQALGDAERFRAFAAELRARGPAEVVVLGDLFRALVGFSRFWGKGVQAGLDELAHLRRAGARVVLVEGNRDFFLDEPALAPFRDAWGEVHSFSCGGRRFLLEHGDLVNRRDRAYRSWRRVSKSRPARAWAQLLPAPLARRIVAGTEARLARTNFSYRRELPREDLEAAARRHFASGVDVVMWGHFHRPWRLEENGRAAYVVPGWLESGAVIMIDERGATTFETVDEHGHFVDTPGESWYLESESGAEVR